MTGELGVGDILFDIEQNVHLLLMDYEWIENDGDRWDTWNFIVLGEDRESWYYAVLLEDERFFERLA